MINRTNRLEIKLITRAKIENNDDKVIMTSFDTKTQITPV